MKFPDIELAWFDRYMCLEDLTGKEMYGTYGSLEGRYLEISMSKCSG